MLVERLMTERSSEIDDEWSLTDLGRGVDDGCRVRSMTEVVDGRGVDDGRVRSMIEGSMTDV